MEKKYIFMLKGAIWWEKTNSHPFDLSHVAFIDLKIDANDAREAIRAAEKIVKDLRKENPSKAHRDYGCKAVLSLGTQGDPLWTYHFAKGKMRERYWERKMAEATDLRDTKLYKAASFIYTQPPEPPRPLFRKGGIIRYSCFSKRRVGSRA